MVFLSSLADNVGTNWYKQVSFFRIWPAHWELAQLERNYLHSKRPQENNHVSWVITVTMRFWIGGQQT